MATRLAGRHLRHRVRLRRRLQIIIRRHRADEPALACIRGECRRRHHIPAHAEIVERIRLREQDAPLDGGCARRQRVRLRRSLRVHAPLLKPGERQFIQWHPRGVARFPGILQRRTFLRDARPSAAARLESAPHRHLRCAFKQNPRHPHHGDGLLVPCA